MRFIGRSMLPFGVVYLAFGLLYFGYYIATGQFGAFHAVYAFFAISTAVLSIVQGRNFRRDARFR